MSVNNIVFVERSGSSSIWGYFESLQLALPSYNWTKCSLYAMSFGSRFLNVLSLFFIPIDLFKLFLVCFRADAVVLNFPDPVYWYMRIFDILGVKIVKVNHENLSLLSERLRFASKKIVLKSDLVISVSEATFNEFEMHFSSMHYLKHCLVTHAFNGMSAQDFGSISVRSGNFIFVGRLDDNKRFDLALRWFSQIRVLRPNARLQVIGDGPLALQYEREVRSRRLSDCVFFRGNVDRRLVLEAMGQSEGLLAPSDNESFHMVVLEALFLGCYVIASDIAAHRSIGSRCAENVRIVVADEIISGDIISPPSSLSDEFRSFYCFARFKEEISRSFVELLGGC